MIYKAVIFDSGGVLHPDMAASITSDVKNELKLSPAQATRFWEMVIGTLGVGLVSEDEFWHQVSDELGTRLVLPDENLLGRVYQKLLSPRQALFDLARELRAQGIKTAVLSNTIEPHAKAQRDRGQFEPFDEIFLSNELHLRKPGPEMFEVALKKLGIPAEETIFIDDRDENLDSPSELGMRTILYQSEDALIEEVKALTLPVAGDSPWVSITFLARPDGALLLQHRDDKPTIGSPGGITAWGGRGEPGETPFEGALRELREETSVRPKPNEVVYIGHYKAEGDERNFWAFEVKEVDDTALEVFEGQGFVVLKDLSQMDSLPVLKLIKQIIREHSLL